MTSHPAEGGAALARKARSAGSLTLTPPEAPAASGSWMPSAWVPALSSAPASKGQGKEVQEGHVLQ